MKSAFFIFLFFIFVSCTNEKDIFEHFCLPNNGIGIEGRILNDKLRIINDSSIYYITYLFDSTGCLQSACEYLNGKQHGKYVNYDKNGYAYTVATMKYGKPDGSTYYHDLDSQLYVVCNYVQGKMHGFCIHFDSIGSIKLKRKYNMGQLIFEERFKPKYQRSYHLSADVIPYDDTEIRKVYIGLPYDSLVELNIKLIYTTDTTQNYSVLPFNKRLISLELPNRKYHPDTLYYKSDDRLNINSHFWQVFHY